MFNLSIKSRKNHINDYRMLLLMNGLKNYLYDVMYFHNHNAQLNTKHKNMKIMDQKTYQIFYSWFTVRSYQKIVFMKKDRRFPHYRTAKTIWFLYCRRLVLLLLYYHKNNFRFIVCQIYWWSNDWECEISSLNFKFIYKFYSLIWGSYNMIFCHSSRINNCIHKVTS